MNLTIPPGTKVFRLRRPGKPAGQWHILKKTVPNGYTEKGLTNTITGQMEHPEYLNTSTLQSSCDFKIDERHVGTGVLQEGELEYSTVADVNKICPSCWPFEILVMVGPEWEQRHLEDEEAK